MSKTKPNLLPSLRARTNSKSFKRGEEYHASGMVVDIQQEGNTIYAECMGSEDEDYEIEIHIEGNEIIDADCSCPYEGDGDCKHIVAVILTYLEHYQPIVEVVNAQAKVRPLEQRSKEELIALINEMVGIHRDLKSLLSRPTPNQKQPISLQFVHDNLRLAIKNFEPYRNNRVALNHIHTIVKTAQSFADAQDWHNTSVICRALWDRLTNEQEYPVYDQEGEFLSALLTSVPLMQACLDQPAFRNDTEERQTMLNCLLRTILWDNFHGQMGDGTYELQELLTGFTTSDDLPALKAQIENRLKSTSNQYTRQPLIELLNELEYAVLTDPQLIIERLTAEADFGELTLRYIEWERYDDAITTLRAKPIPLWEFLTALNALITNRQSSQAIALATERIEQDFQPQLAEWLMKVYSQQGKHTVALEWAYRLMIYQPRMDYYKTLKELALRLNQWQPLRAKLYQEFAWEDKYSILFEMLMEDQEWDQAWAVLPKTKSNTLGYGYSNEYRLATTTFRSHPTQALPILKKQVEQFIGQRDRSAYAGAASHLVMVQAAYNALHQKEEGQRYIEGLRTAYKNLPAFQDELRKAKL